MSYTPVIGLEIHIELNTERKMFCQCKIGVDNDKPNTRVCPICLGYPGTLPTINFDAVKKVIKTGLALKCEISRVSLFERKNYFYPDLPKGYQISQYKIPLCKNGVLEISGKKIRIRRIHLEEDTGKLLHEHDYSFVDFNRAGVPLMELVTEPDLTCASEAEEFAKELQLILKYLEVSDADMERGKMRVEANISLKREGDELGKKVEIKNLNSFYSLKEAIDFEIKRQRELLEAGKEVIQETRGWDENKRITFSQREKEAEKDYRYFPEPDLPPIFIDDLIIEELKKEIPELPKERRERLINDFSFKSDEVEILVRNREIGSFFDQVMKNLQFQKTSKDFLTFGQLVKNYLLSDLVGIMRKLNLSLPSPKHFFEFIMLLFEGKISSKIAKEILEKMVRENISPNDLIKREGISLIDEMDKLEDVVNRIIHQYPEAVNDYLSGKKGAIQFLIGKAMAETKGRANPKKLAQLFSENLNK